MNATFGHREVFDVTSAASGPQPFRLRLRESGLFPAGPQGCPGTHRPPVGRTGRLRVRSFGSGQPIVEAVLGGALGVPPDRTETIPVGDDEAFKRLIQEWDFDLEVPANAVPFVDVYYSGVGGNFQAPVVDFLTGQECALTVVGASWLEPDGGIQLHVSPGPGLSAEPRSGIAYAPVPEPGALASGGVALVVLAWRRRRRP